MEEASAPKQYLLEFLSEHTVPLLGTLRVYVQRQGLATGEEGAAAAMEVLQETAVEALSHADRFDPARQPMAWLLGIAIHVIQRKKAERARRSRRELLLSRLSANYPEAGSESDMLDLLIPVPVAGPEQAFEMDEQVRELLSLVPGDDQRVLRLAFLEDFEREALVNQALIEHWDGLKWSIVPSPNVNGQQCMLYGVAGAAANDVWAVGVTLNYNTGTGTTLVEHWNGTRWNIIDSPKVGTGNILMQVKAISANNIWAVGYYYATKEDQQNNVSRTLTEHWDGTKWHVIPSPNPKSQSNVVASSGKEVPNMPEMWGVAGVPGSRQVWAVGIQIQVASLSFIERFS